MSMVVALVMAQLATATVDPPVRAQGPPASVGEVSPAPPAAAEVGTWEVVVSVGAASSVNLFQSEADRRYLVQTVSWGRELTRDLGPGVLRGRFAWAVEAMPVFAQVSPSHLYGFGVAPLLWRWNFVPRPRWSAYAELSMGGLWTTDPIPEDTSRVNFTAHWGGGMRWRRSPAQSVVLAYRFQHISNGNQFNSNPGVNSHVALIGWSYARPR